MRIHEILSALCYPNSDSWATAFAQVIGEFEEHPEATFQKVATAMYQRVVGANTSDEGLALDADDAAKQVLLILIKEGLATDRPDTDPDDPFAEERPTPGKITELVVPDE